MKVAYATADWSTSVKGPDGVPEIGGAGFYRCDIPSRVLSAHGMESHVGLPAFDDTRGLFALQSWDGDLWHDFDIFVMQRWMLPEGADHVRWARANGQRIVNDLDDWFFGLHNTNAAATTTKGQIGHYLKILQASDLVTTSTPWLARQLERKGCRTAVIENKLDYDVTPWTPKVHRDTERLKIGWCGAIPWRSEDIETVARPLQQIMERHPKLRFQHSGHLDLKAKGWPDFAELSGLDPDRIDTLPLMPVRGVPALYQPMDIGIVPLNAIPFNRGKSFLKGLEFAASGIPFVAQEIDSYAELRLRGIGRTAGKAKHWLGNLEELLDYGIRSAEAERQECIIQSGFVAQRCVENWVEAYRSLM